MESKRFYHTGEQIEAILNDYESHLITGKEITVGEVFGTLTEEQKTVVYYLVGVALGRNEKQHMVTVEIED